MKVSLKGFIYHKTAERYSDCFDRFGVNMKRVEIMVIPIDDVWARDTSPVFVKDAAGKLSVTDWNFNGWGDGGAMRVTG